jgi:hypothetical protein
LQSAIIIIIIIIIIKLDRRNYIYAHKTGDVFPSPIFAKLIQGGQKVSAHLMITVQKKAKIFKRFKSLTMIA